MNSWSYSVLKPSRWLMYKRLEIAVLEHNFHSKLTLSTNFRCRNTSQTYLCKYDHSTPIKKLAIGLKKQGSDRSLFRLD